MRDYIIEIRSDASAAIGIANRIGVGKVRHIEVNQLWLQDKVNTGEIEVMKVKGEGNLADALTKPLEGPGVKKHIALTRQELVEGRNVLTPEFETAEEERCDRQEQEEGGGEDQDEVLECVSRWPAGVEVLDLLCLSRLETAPLSGLPSAGPLHVSA